MPSPDLTLLANQFQEFGGPIFGRHVIDWKLRELGIQVRSNVKAPQALVKLSALGTPRPYRITDDFADGAQFSERLLIAYQSKQDWTFDPENFRNTVLANASGAPFYEQCLNQSMKEYLDKITRLTLWNGVYNAAGTGAADLCSGWGTILAALVTAGTVVPIVTGAITTANAVASVELMKSAAPVWMRQFEGEVPIYCSYSVFDKYATNYRTVNGFKFEPRITGDYPIDNSNFILRPVAFLNTSQKLVMTLPNNLVFGTDSDNIKVFATPYLNYLKIRQLFPTGCEIQDTEAIFLNDQA